MRASIKMRPHALYTTRVVFSQHRVQRLGHVHKGRAQDGFARLRVEVAPMIQTAGAALHGALLRDKEAAQRQMHALDALA
jgi:hypothetical protein